MDERNQQQNLKEKAILLVRRERELFDLRMKHEQVTLWLRLAQSLPQLFLDHRLSLAELYGRLQKALVSGLRFQRVLFFELDGESASKLPDGAPRPLGPEATALLNGPPSFCNEPNEPALATLASVTGLYRFVWSRIVVAGKLPVIVVAGFDKMKAMFQSPFDAGDAAQFANTSQHVEALIGNALLVREIEEAEKHRLLEVNQTLERRDRELFAATEQLKAANETLEQRVRDRTEELALRNRDMRLVLDNIHQALLTIDENGRLSRERSAIADRWFGAYDGTPTFAEHIEKSDPAICAGIRDGLRAAKRRHTPHRGLDRSTPRPYSQGRARIPLHLLPALGRGKPEGAAHRDRRRYRAAATSAGRIGAKRAHGADARAHARSTRVLVVHGRSRANDRGTLVWHARRQPVASVLHTLKGTTAMVGGTMLAALCHRAEEELGEEGLAGPQPR